MEGKSISGWWFQIYFAYESRHQHGAFDMTGGFKYDILFSPPKLGEMIQIDEHIFSDGLVKNHQLDMDESVV